MPGDAFIRRLLADLGFVGLLDAADVRAPEQPAIVELADLDDAVHEARELLELRPLIVRQRAAGTGVFAYFNNDADGHAVESARTLIAMVRGRRHPTAPSGRDRRSARAGG